MTSKKNRSPISNIKWIRRIQYLLLIPIAYSLGYMIYAAATAGLNEVTYEQMSDKVRILALSLVAMAISVAFARLEKDLHIHLPKALLVTILLFISAALVIGDGFGQYERFWWWDDVLHTISGVITALVGYLLVYFLNARYNMHLSPLFVAVFAFSFAITMGAIWEIFEFSVDAFFHTNMQRWMLPSNAVLIGREYQGSGLRDTMSDLIVACIGALLASMATYFTYKNDKRRVIGIMRRTFPRLARKE